MAGHAVRYVHYTINSTGMQYKTADMHKKIPADAGNRIYRTAVTS